jgi:hypothetical protein
MLLEKGADINASDSDGRTVLQYATLSGNKLLLRILLETGVERMSRISEKPSDPGGDPTGEESHLFPTVQEGVVGLEAHLSVPARDRGTVPFTPSVNEDEENNIFRWKRNRKLRELLKLLIEHPGSGELQRELALAYRAKGDHDEAIAGWWAILERYPYQVGIMTSLRAATELKWSALEGTSLMFFALLCLLSYLSRKFEEWDMG